MANAIAAFGTLLKRNGVTIAEVNDISGPGLSREDIEVTHQQSPGRWAEFIKGVLNAGEVSFDVNMIPTDTTQNYAAGMLGDFASHTAIDTWSIVFPNAGATTWSFPGFITKYEPKAPVKDKLGASVTIKVSGQPTLV